MSWLLAECVWEPLVLYCFIPTRSDIAKALTHTYYFLTVGLTCSDDSRCSLESICAAVTLRTHRNTYIPACLMSPCDVQTEPPFCTGKEESPERLSTARILDSTKPRISKSSLDLETPHMCSLTSLLLMGDKAKHLY